MLKNHFFLKLSLIAIFLLSIWSISIFSQNIEIIEAPEWIKKIDPEIKSKVSSYEINSGYYTSLYDHQINLEKGSEFQHYKIKILTNGGVANASQIYISCDTAYQNIQFHYLYVWRNGKKIDRTNTLTFETLNNENNLQAGIYTGLMTAHEILEDIRKNDIIEYAYSINGENPIFDDKRFKLIPLEDGNPIDHFYFSAIHPANEEYFYRCFGSNQSIINSSIHGEYKLLEIEKRNIEAVELEETIPTWHIPFQHVIITNTRNWEEVNKWALGVFELEKEPELNVVFEEILSGDEGLDEKIDEVINYVQNEIRYMGLENGIGSIKPFPPEQVVKQRFGDCKDKSLLLVSLLKKLGVTSSYPVLVNSMLRHKIAEFLPSNHLFDHCIVYFEHEGKGYWIDPTNSQQGGNYKSKCITDYGKALIVREGINKLTPMNIEDKYSKTEIKESLLVQSFSEPATLKVESKLYGLNADFFRNMLEYYSLQELSKSFKDIYSPIFPNIIEVDKMNIEDDKKNNVISLTEFYSIEEIWHRDESMSIPRRVFQFEPIGLYNYVTPTSCEIKKFPVQVPFPSNYSQKTTISLPDKINITEEDISFENDAFSYRKKIEGKGNKTIVLTYWYRTKQEEVKAEVFNKVCRDINKIIRGLPLQIFYPVDDFTYQNRINL